MKDKKSSRIFSWLLSAAQTALIVTLVIVAVFSFASRVPLLARMGLTFYSVVSGSMEPAIPTGSLIYAGRFTLENLKKDDIITFQVKSEANPQPVVVTHRIAEVVKKEKVEKGPDGQEKKVEEYSFITKGDANSESDINPVLPGDILGKYKWHLPHLGRLSIFAQTPFGFALLVILPAAILVVWELTSLVLHFKREYQRKSEDEIAKLKAELQQKKQPTNE